MTDQTPEPEPGDEPITDSWNVSDSANELGVDAFSLGRLHGPGEVTVTLTADTTAYVAALKKARTATSQLERRLRRRRLTRRIGRIAPWWRRFKANGYRLDRCAECGHRFRWSRDPRHANGNRDGKHYHGPCLSYVTWRRKAEDRLTVLDVALHTTHTTPKDLRDLASLQYSDLNHDARAIGNNRVWSVLYDLEKRGGTNTVGSSS